MTRQHVPGLPGDLQALIVDLACLEVPELEAVEDALVAVSAGLAGEEEVQLLDKYQGPEQALKAFQALTGREPGKRGRSRGRRQQRK